DLKVTDATNATVWVHAGVLTSQTSVDLSGAAQRSLGQSVKKGGALATGFKLSAGTPTTIRLRRRAPVGFLVRSAPGTLKADLEGEPVTLGLGDPLANEIPASVKAIVVLRYKGIRLLESVADVLGAAGPVSGMVVGAEPVRRDLPPGALTGLSVARIGVIGRAPASATLSALLVDQLTGQPLGRAATAKVTAAASFSTVWLALPVPQRP